MRDFEYDHIENFLWADKKLVKTDQPAGRNSSGNN